MWFEGELVIVSFLTLSLSSMANIPPGDTTMSIQFPVYYNTRYTMSRFQYITAQDIQYPGSRILQYNISVNNIDIDSYWLGVVLVLQYSCLIVLLYLTKPNQAPGNELAR